MNLSRVLLLILAFMAIPSLVSAEISMRFQHLSRADGLSQAYVYAITQDQQGYMWFGTQGGLNRFDGREFRVFRSNPLEAGNLPHNTVRDLLVDRDDRLWLATDRGLAYLAEDGESFQGVPLNGEAVQPLVRSLHQDETGDIWAGTQGFGLYHVSGDQATQASPALSEARVWALAPGSQGFLWVGTESGLFRFHPASNQLFRYGLHAGDAARSGATHVRSLLTDKEGRLWVGTGDGLYRWREADRFEELTFPEGTTSAGRQVSDITQDCQGRLWISTFDGLYLLNPEEGQLYPYRNSKADPYSLAHNTVLSVFEDVGHVLWIGTYEGVDRWNGLSGAMHHYNVANTRSELRSDTIASFAEDREQRIWVGTFGGGLQLFDAREDRFIPYEASLTTEERAFLQSERVMSLATDRAGALWIGTRRSGLARLQASGDTGYELTRYRHEPGNQRSLSSDSISSILEDADGNLWVATFGGGMNRFDPATGEFDRFLAGPMGGLPGNNILSLFEDRSGNVWVGAQDGGLSFYNRANDQFQRYQVQAGNPIFSVASLGQDGNGDLWIGTLEFGLWHWANPATDQAELRYYNRENGLPDDAIYSIQVVDETVWVSTNNGIAGVPIGEGGITILDVSDGLQSLEFNHGASLKSTSGALYFGGVNGFNVFSPAELQANANGPPSSITHVQIGDRHVPLHNLDSIELDHRDYLLSFRFVGMDYVSPDQNRFRYRLANLDDEWIDVGTRGEARFTNLNPGTYQFYVQSANNKQVWGPALGPIEVIVHPAPWATWWAYGMYLLIAALLIGAVVRAQSRRIRLANEVIETNAALRQEVHLREFKEQQLRLEKDRVQGYLDASQLIHIELDKAGVIRFIDDHGLKVLGCEDGEAVGRRLVDLVTTETEAEFMMLFEQSEQRDHEFVVENLRHGSRKVLWRSRMVVDSEAAEMRRLLVGMDVTEIRQLEVAVRQREKMGAMGELAGGLAHDFNNILTAIYGYGVLAWQRAEDGSTMADHLQKIVQASERARSLVERLLTFARSEESELEDVDVRVPIREAAELLRGSLPASLVLDLQLPDYPLGAHADTTRIHQLIMNLGTNAAKAMRATQGTMTVSAEKVELTATRLPPDSVLKPGPHVKISVKDTGIGIARENLEQIYNPFFTTSGEGFGGDIQGTGLGLSVVQAIVNAHHGYIDVDSYPGTGTTFTVWLPYRELELFAEENYRHAFLPADMGVVLVDDDDMVGEVGQVILETLGYEVTRFVDPLEAYNYFLNLDPETRPMLVTDEVMPGMLGSELLVKVRDLRPDIPVILTSGNLKAYDREDGVFFMRKPYTLDDFQHMIERAVGYQEAKS